MVASAYHRMFAAVKPDIMGQLANESKLFVFGEVVYICMHTHTVHSCNARKCAKVYTNYIERTRAHIHIYAR